MSRLKESSGMKDTPEYAAWVSMKGRCNNKSHSAYSNYGGRGITVCGKWNESFLGFYNDMGSRPSDEHSLDRIDHRS